MKKNIKAIKQELLETINDLYIEYKLPPMNISDKEWDLYLHVVESHFMAHNNMDDFIHALNILIRRGLYFAQMNKDEEFTIHNLVKALPDLIAFKMYSDETKTMKEEVTEKVKKYGEKK